MARPGNRHYANSIGTLSLPHHAILDSTHQDQHCLTICTTKMTRAHRVPKRKPTISRKTQSR